MSNNHMTEKDIKKVEDLTRQLLDLVGIDAKIELSKDEENQAIVININAEDEAGLLIGNRGRTINSFQSVIAQMVNQGMESWTRIFLNVADWREKEERRLQELALQTAERARETGERQDLYNLTAAQRRIVHMTLSGEEDIETLSEGEGKDRYLVILPK